VEGRELTVYWNFPPIEQPGSPLSAPTLTLLIGGTHGDESATVPILENFIRTHLETGKVNSPTAVISLLNPDGFARTTRYNAHGVDLNRNFPHNWSALSEEPPGTAPLSEPESRCLHAFILAYRPRKIVSLHWALAELDADGEQSIGLARHMWAALSPAERKPYRLRLSEPSRPDLSQPNRSEIFETVRAAISETGRAATGMCTGSLGQWCGHGLVYPDSHRPAMITLELPHHPHSHPRPEALPDDHLDLVRDHWDKRSGDYLAGVEGTVHRLLEAACQFDIHDIHHIQTDSGSDPETAPPATPTHR